MSYVFVCVYAHGMCMCMVCVCMCMWYVACVCEYVWDVYERRIKKKTKNENFILFVF